ncbi:hypothetical protein GCM10010404_63080 [Nonomuraea africana]
MIKRDLAAYAFLIPWFAGLLLLVVMPLGWSLYLSFTDYDLLSDPTWVGFGTTWSCSPPMTGSCTPS